MTNREASEEALLATSADTTAKIARKDLQSQSEDLRATIAPEPAKNAATNDQHLLTLGYPQVLTEGNSNGSKHAEGMYGEGIFSRMRQRVERKTEPRTRETVNTDRVEESEVSEEPVASDIGAPVAEKIDPRRNFSKSEDGTITALFPNGDVRKFTTDGTNDIQTLSFYDSKNKVTHEYKRLPHAGDPAADGSSNFEYQKKDATGKVVSSGNWKGDLEWRDGEYAVRESAQSNTGIPNDFWRVEYTDGTSVRRRENSNGSVQLHDSKWALLRMERPDKSSVECTRNEQSALLAVMHTDRDGKQISWKADSRGFWVASSPDIADSGQPPVDKEGNVKYSLIDGTKVEVSHNGSEVRTNPDHTVVHRDQDGAIKKVAFADGTYRQFEYSEGKVSGFSLHAKDGSKIGGSEGLSNIKIDELGHISYETSDGSSVLEGPGNTRTEKYADGRLKAVQYPGGDLREFTYVGATEQLDTFKVTSAKTKATTEYVRNGEKDEYACKTTTADGRVSETVWKGDMAVRHGMFSFKGDGGKEGFWNARSSDGNTFYERENADGSQQLFDSNLKIASVYRTDGSELHCQRAKNGELLGVTSISDDDKASIQFKLNKQNGQWVSDSNDIAASTSAPINANGELLYKNLDGTHNHVRLDGSSERTNLDGSKAILDEAGVVERLERANGDYRVFNYDNGKLIGYSDFDKAGKEKSNVKDLTEPSVNDHGDIGYRTKEGRRVLERTDGTVVQYQKDNDEQIYSVKASDGSTRHFYYEKGSNRVQQVLDTWHDGTKWNQDLWQSRLGLTEAGAVAGLSKTFEKVDIQTGRVLDRRTDVNFRNYGDYSFKGADGKTEFSSASTGFRVPGQPVVETQQRAVKTETAPVRLETTTAPAKVEKPVPTKEEVRAELLKKNVSQGENNSLTIKYSTGDSRTVRTAEDGSGDVVSLSRYNVKDKRTYEYTRIEGSTREDGNSDFTLVVKDSAGRKVSEGKWNGALRYANDEMSIREGSNGGKKSDNVWRTIAIDGETTHKRINSNGSTNVFDDSGNFNLISTTRADGSSVECIRDKANNLTSVVDTKADGSKTTWTFDSSSRLWVSDDPNLKASATSPVNRIGEMEFTDQYGRLNRIDTEGVLSYKNPDGTVAAVNSDGVVTRVNHPSGEYRTFNRAEDGSITGFTDFGKDGAPKKSLDGLEGASMDAYGLLEYRTKDGVSVSEGLNGVRVESRPPNKTFIQYASGDTREFVRAENSGELDKVTHFRKSENTTVEYVRSGVAGEWNYRMTDARGKESVGVFRGEMAFRDGLFAVKSDSITKAPKGYWHERDASDNEFIERQNSDGSRARFDAKTKALETLYRADGSRLDCHRPGGELQAVRNVTKDGTEVTWTFDKSTGKWSSDSPEYLASNKPPVSDAGILSIQRKDGAVDQVSSDGSIARTIPGGTRIDFTPEGLACRATMRNGEYRIYKYEKDLSECVGFSDYDKSGKVLKSVDIADAKIDAMGSIEHTVNGARVMERADRSVVQFEAGDPSLIKRVTAVNGSYREFVRNENGDVIAIDDVTKTRNSEKHALWARRENVRPPFGPGGLSETFERVTPNLSRVVDTRSNVKLSDSGDYTYVDKRGKERISAATGRQRGAGDEFGSASIDEAHYNLVDTAAAVFGNEARTAAFEQMMKGFERRMADTVLRRVGENREKVEEEVEKEVTQAYDSIAQMLDPSVKGFDSPARRAQLADALMYLLWEPQTAKQAGRNSCWFMSQWNEDVARHPGTFAKIFADVSLTGKCKDRFNADYSFTQDELAQSASNHGVGWSIDRAGVDDQTSPAVDRMERVLLKIGGFSADRWRWGGDSNEARNALAKVIAEPIGWMGGQFPSTRNERIEMLKHGGAVKNGGPRHVNNMFVRAVRLDALGKVVQQRDARRQNSEHLVDKIGDDENEPRRIVFGLFRGDQYERDKLVALIKDPKAFIENGEMAPVNEIHYPAPKLGKEFQVAESYTASDFKPGNRPNGGPNNSQRRRRRG